MSNIDLTLSILNRTKTIFDADIHDNAHAIKEIVSANRFLIIGGAGSIGKAVVREIFQRDPVALHVVDVSENSMVELVRDLRSSVGYTAGDFRTFCIDCGGPEFDALVNFHGPYDYVFNLSALKHVRSERDPFTLMRMIEVNILNTIKTIDVTRDGLSKYFCVSTDKAANPVNMMGASKRIMEMFLQEQCDTVDISTARFANVAFSDGSLPAGFINRFEQKQPLSAPSDILRYFVTSREAGELCLMSGLLGKNKDIFFPNNTQLKPMSFSSIAERYLASKGYEAVLCSSEDEARARVAELEVQKKWPVHFTESDTTGEKPCEEFYTSTEALDLVQFKSVGIVKNTQSQSSDSLREFAHTIRFMRSSGSWNKESLVELFEQMIPEFKHIDTGKYLDQKM